MSRSKNPDLIYDDIVQERAERIKRLELASKKELLDKITLDRVTLFVTHRCNLLCRYCNGPHLDKLMDQNKRKIMLESDFSFEQYKRFIDEWSAHELRNIHFTGGEATLNRHLPEFIAMAAEKGISSTLTTNGTAGHGLYRKLVDRGLSEIRISLDSTVDSDFDETAGVKGACRKIKDNIEELVCMRDKEGKDICLILNACIDSYNLEEIESTMRSLIDLNPDDIKFLVVAEQSRFVHVKAARSTVDRLLSDLKQSGKDYPLLEKKIHALFRKSSFGLKDCAARYEMEHCYIPLTERTLDARGIYPCSIYLRYKGAPVIQTDAGFDEQQRAIDDFVENHDCRKDEICKDNCTYCCKNFNLEANRKIRDYRNLKFAEENVIVVNEISQDEIRGLLETNEKITKINGTIDNPYAIIKPQGFDYRFAIMEYLEEQGIRILKQIPIEDWSTFSLYLYFKEGRSPESRLARNKAHRAIEHNNAIYLQLEKGVPEKKIFRIKREFREWFGEQVRFVKYKDEMFKIRFNCFHVPDYDRIEAESRVARYFLGI